MESVGSKFILNNDKDLDAKTRREEAKRRLWEKHNQRKIDEIS